MVRDLAGVVVDIGDVAVLLHASDEGRADVLLHHLGAAPPHAGAPRATVRFDAVGPPVPSGPPRLTIEDIRAWPERTCLRLAHASGTSAIVTADEVWVGGGSGDDVAGPFHRMLLLVVAHLLAHHDRYVLHAAAVVPRAEAVLVLGDTGRGKSTAAVAGLDAGWPVLGDDMVVVRVGVGGPEVAGVARPGALPADVGAAIGGSPLAGDPRGRRELAASAFTSGWFPVTAAVRVSHGSAADGSLRDLEPRAALYALMSAFPGALTPQFLRGFLPVAAAVSRGPAFDLLLGAEPSRRLAGTARLLASTCA